MSGLIVVFSALGGTIGSMITGQIFENFSGTTAFYFSLVPVTIIFILIWILDNILKNQKQVIPNNITK
jgi:predicted MFS family arabinose efflux permease